MLGPKTDNTVTDSQNVSQVGHNSGTIQIGLTFQEHEQNVRERLAALRDDLNRAHGAERSLLQAQADAALASLSNLQADYEKTLAELSGLKATLARFDNVLDRTKHQAADAALDRGDRSLARALLEELAMKARARREDASVEEAELEYKLGEIAETEIRWHDAATHYARAATLAPDFDRLYKAIDFAIKAGQYDQADCFASDLVANARTIATPENLSRALDQQASVLRRKGRLPAAEALLTEALTIDRATIGEAHPDFATHINSLAGIMKAQRRFLEAERLYRQALEIGRSTIGEEHPDHATRLNNLAGVMRAQGRYSEAEALYRQALEIGRATIGEAHPSYANRLNNLALALKEQGRYPEANDLYKQAMEILHASLGDQHPRTKTVAKNYLDLLLTHNPTSPMIPTLQSLTAPPSHPSNP